jgi:hypothetical protein
MFERDTFNMTVGGGGGAVSTVHDREAGVLLAPSRLLARTLNECGPLANPLYEVGDVQGANAAASS